MRSNLDLAYIREILAKNLDSKNRKIQTLR